MIMGESRRKTQYDNRLSPQKGINETLLGI